MATEAGLFKWKGRLGPFDLRVSENTFSPSTISVLLAEAMEIEPGDTVVDVGCGSGVLSIIAAKLGAGHVFGIDAAPDVVEVASANAEQQGVGDKITFLHGDLFDPLPDGLTADVVIGDVSGIPDVIAAESGWFPSRRGGGPRGSELPIRMLEGVQDVLRKGGRFFLPTGTLQDEAAILEKARTIFAKLTQVKERAIPLPTALSQSTEVLQLMKDRVIDLTSRGSRKLWTAKVWEGSLT
jgi:protein-L-isoaspartate O-methyltransferase